MLSLKLEIETLLNMVEEPVGNRDDAICFTEDGVRLPCMNARAE
jgi:hypothetical protein